VPETETAEYIGPLTDLEKLAGLWRAYITAHAGETGQDPYLRGLGICAEQLEETIRRMLDA
jgi:hypothetical protein